MKFIRLTNANGGRQVYVRAETITYVDASDTETTEIRHGGGVLIVRELAAYIFAALGAEVVNVGEPGRAEGAEL